MEWVTKPALSVSVEPGSEFKVRFEYSPCQVAVSHEQGAIIVLDSIFYYCQLLVFN